MDEQPTAKLIEADDEEFELPDGRTSWIVSLVILTLAGAAALGLAATQLPKLLIASFVLLASFAAPFVSGVRGYVAVDRVVPFAGVLGVLGMVGFVICLDVGSQGHFYPGRGHLDGPLLYMMTFAGVPTASVLGGVLGCKIYTKRRGGKDESDYLM